MKNLWLFFLVGLSTGFINEKIFVLSQSTSSTTDDLYIEGRTSGDLPIDDEDSENDGSGSGSGDYAFTDLSDQEKILRRFHDMSKTSVTKEMLPFQTQPTVKSPQNPPTTVADSQDPALTEQDGDDRNMENEMPGMNPTSNHVKGNSSPSNMPLSETTTQFKMDITVTEDVDDNKMDTWNGAATKDEVLNNSGKDVFAEMGRSGSSHEINNPQEVTSENLWERTEVLAAVIACGVVGFLCAVFLLLFLAYRMKKKDEGSYDLGDTKLSATAYHKAPTKEFYA